MRKRTQSVAPIDWSTLPLVVDDVRASEITGFSLSFFRKSRSRNLKNRLKGPPYIRDGKLILYRVKDLKAWVDSLETRMAV